MVGGGLAGLSSAVVLAEAGFKVCLLERRPHLGGRATSYDLPGGEHVDNCQHVTLGCCTNLEDFYRRVGAGGKISWYKRLYFVDRSGKRGTIHPSGLPAPFHLAPSFISFPALSWSDKLAIARGMLAVAREHRSPPDPPISMLDWLQKRGQTPNAIENFWRVVLVSALDEELDRTDARYGIEVFWKCFIATRRGFEVGIPSVPLADLYDGCREAIERSGGEVRTRANIRQLKITDGICSGVELDDGSMISGDFILSAVPHDILIDLLSPEVIQGRAEFAGLRDLKVSPITGVHFWYDRQVMTEPFLTLLERTTQWIFNKTLLTDASQVAREGQPAGAVQYLQLVISASYGLIPKSRAEIIEICKREVEEVLPAIREAQLVKATVIKETAATFSPSPGSDRWRPAQRTSIQNLFLAGDWTRTGWPATMEGAVRSGYLAAEAILATGENATRVLQPDLRVEGLSRFWADK